MIGRQKNSILVLLSRNFSPQEKDFTISHLDHWPKESVSTLIEQIYVLFRKSEKIGKLLTSKST